MFTTESMMSFNLSRVFRKYILFLLYGFSFAGLISGFMLCLLESPETKANMYLSMADQYEQQAMDFTLIAISYTPYNDEAWKKLNKLQSAKQAFIQQEKLQNFAFNNLD